jgi:hypothetical protein
MKMHAWESLLVNQDSDRIILKASKIVDEILPFLGILQLSPSVFEQNRSMLNHLEGAVYVMDKIVEKGQRAKPPQPWNIEKELTQWEEAVKDVDMYHGLAPMFMSPGLRGYFQMETDCIASEQVVDLASLRRVWLYRSNDLRCMCCILSDIAGRKHIFESDLHTQAALDALFLIAEVAYDIRDYEKDRASDSFNTMRMFSRLFGPDLALPLLLTELQQIREQFEEALPHMKEAARVAAIAVFDDWWGRLKFAPILEEKCAPPSTSTSAPVLTGEKSKPTYTKYTKPDAMSSSWKDRVMDLKVTCCYY